MLPIAEAEAIADPAMEPINIAEIILIKANPPGKKPTRVFANEISLLAIPPSVIICPERIKKGIANNAKLSNPVAILCETVVKDGNNGTLTIIVNREEIAIDHATGTEKTRRIPKLITSTNIGKYSIICYDLKFLKFYSKLLKPHLLE